MSIKMSSLIEENAFNSLNNQVFVTINHFIEYLTNNWFAMDLIRLVVALVLPYCYLTSSSRMSKKKTI